MRIGVFGGTFDPIHNGHMVVAREVLRRVYLDQVVFVPAGQPWMKDGRYVSNAEDRVNMVRLATEGNPLFEVSTVEVERPGPSYTIDTLMALRKKYGSEARLFVILGIDALEQFHRWRDTRGISRQSTLVVVSRPIIGAASNGQEKTETQVKRLAAVSGYEDLVLGERDGLWQDSLTLGTGLTRVVILDGLSIDVSGRDIRNRVRMNNSITAYVSPRVEQYITEKKIYLEEYRDV